MTRERAPLGTNGWANAGGEMAVDTRDAGSHDRGVMLRRLGTALLVVALACGGLVSSACGATSCAQMTRARMRCCPVDGIQQARSCCAGHLGKAAPAAAAALERAPQAPAPLALPARVPATTAVVISASPRAVPPPGSGPPDSLLRQHTSLLL